MEEVEGHDTAFDQDLPDIPRRGRSLLGSAAVRQQVCRSLSLCCFLFVFVLGLFVYLVGLCVNVIVILYARLYTTIHMRTHHHLIMRVLRSCCSHMNPTHTGICTSRSDEWGVAVHFCRKRKGVATACGRDNAVITQHVCLPTSVSVVTSASPSPTSRLESRLCSGT
jgi:hypothetical protein